MLPTQYLSLLVEKKKCDLGVHGNAHPKKRRKVTVVFLVYPATFPPITENETARLAELV